ncbi:MAG: YbaB/EbfC family nucleoid-associated protein [Candidatus Cloacimonetes bacterium]|nr:YbaB/EbfC family nucleoid-associated protein [Candidatus Cloacimonadota bacterium]
MFDKAKKLYQLKKEAGALQKTLSEDVLEVSHKGVIVRIRGDMHILSIKIDGQDSPKVCDGINKAIKEAQKLMAKKMRGKLTDFGIPGL